MENFIERKFQRTFHILPILVTHTFHHLFVINLCIIISNSISSIHPARKRVCKLTVTCAFINNQLVIVPAREIDCSKRLNFSRKALRAVDVAVEVMSLILADNYNKFPAAFISIESLTLLFSKTR
jgi:hypothetical protein